jgi:integrase
VDGHARANRHKPSGIASVESHLKWHLIPELGSLRLDAIGNERIQQLKLSMANLSPKTANNVLGTLSVLLRNAVAWGELEKLPCTIVPLKEPRSAGLPFYYFEDYQRLVSTAHKRGADVMVMVLLGGDGGLRLGEIVGLEWGDIDLQRGYLTVARSDWCGQGGAGYGDRTRVRGLGSLCTTIVLSPRQASRGSRPAEQHFSSRPDQRNDFVPLALHHLRGGRLEVEAEQRLGIRRPHVEVPVGILD